MSAAASSSSAPSHPLPFSSQSHSSSSFPRSLSFIHQTPSPPLALALATHHSPSPPLPLTLSPSSRPTAGPFVGPDTPRRLRVFDDFVYEAQLGRGSLKIRPMRDAELDHAVGLLAGSFAESMGLPAQYVSLLAFLVRQYIVERVKVVPHMAVLVGFYKGESDGEEEGELACAVEISFDAVGANATPPTPLPPMECPYICNMTVKKELRRKQIGTHLLRACEELMNKMKTERRVFLHCRVVDKVPFRMYEKAGYKVVKTDSVLVWLSLQRRKYLMCKELQPIMDHSDGSDCDHTD